MPITFEEYTSTLDASNDAHATVTVVVTDEAGVELGRREIKARVNADLRADDPKRRGMKIHARDRMKELLLKRARKAEAEIMEEVAKTKAADAIFGTLLSELEAEVAPNG